MIFPEGTSSTGNQILAWKVGSFVGEHSIQMFSIEYHNMQGICPSLLTVPGQYVFFLNCCRHPFGTATLKKYPVFKPNQFFWDNFWEPNKDKESRAETYCRIMRQIMLEETGLKDANEHA
jgi:hypothetical protein